MMLRLFGLFGIQTTETFKNLEYFKILLKIVGL